MRFAWLGLMISILICAPLGGGCDKAKKEEQSGKGMVTPPKKKNPHGVEHPPVPEAPP